MNAAQYLRLIPVQQRKLWIGTLTVLGLLIGLGVFHRPADPDTMYRGAFMLLMIPALLSGAFTLISYETLSRPATALLPGIEREIFRWHLALVIAGSIALGCVIHLVLPAMPIAAAAALAAGVVTMGLPLHRREWTLTKVLCSLTGLVAGVYFTRTEGVEETLMRLVAAHPMTSALAGLVVAGLNIRWASNRPRVRRLQLTIRSVSGAESLRGVVEQMTTGLAASFGQPRSYPPRSGSPIRWIQAVFQERTGPGYLRFVLFVTTVFLFVAPLIGPSAGYSRGWYDLVFNWDTGPGAVACVWQWTALTAFGLAAPFPRKDRLYPLSRTHRALLTFATATVSWLALAAILIGLPLALATFGGWAEAQPLEARAITRFTMPAVGISIPGLAFLRWFTLTVDRRGIGQLAALAFLGFPLVLGGWIFLATAEPITAAISATIAFAGSLLLFYAGVSNYYANSDLVSREA